MVRNEYHYNPHDAGSIDSGRLHRAVMLVVGGMSTISTSNQVVDTKRYEHNYMNIFDKVEGTGVSGGYGGISNSEDVYSKGSPYENYKKNIELGSRQTGRQEAG